MCERYDEYHIGKRSAGWQFIFRGWQDKEFSANSWADWKAHILSGGAVYDEYGQEYMPHEFFKLVEDTMVPGARNSGEYHKYHVNLNDTDVRNDSDGWSISYGEFC